MDKRQESRMTPITELGNNDCQNPSPKWGTRKRSGWEVMKSPAESEI